eukprot:TRINITY_DN1700_c0_g5_i3.p1 TRINITY_DN1700_c0_g5~~TRINITY_DN1700_c0_g5_i3.p1  ORF type:complete len:256 (-),score=69.74 TRINITY_DN1700_c0_g5_i3:407-1174(-)
MKIKPNLVDVMLNYKTKKCSYDHNTLCRFSHSSSDFRRFHIDMQSRTMNYWNILYIPGIMSEAQRFCYCQNMFEYNYHVLNFKTKPCPYLATVGVCQLADHCCYIHPSDCLEEIVTFRAGINPPPTSFNDSAEFIDNTGSYPVTSKGPDRKKPRHIFTLPDGEEAYVLGCVSIKSIGQQVSIYEDSEHEFKNWSLTKNFEWLVDSIQQYICAFSNTNGGTMYLGIADNGTVVGTYCDRVLMDKLGLSVDQIVRGA